MTIWIKPVLAGALLAMAAAPGIAQDAVAPPVAQTPVAPPAAPPAATSGKLTAVLIGDLEVGDEGDPDGKGSATLTIAGGKLCFDVEYRRLAPVTMAHVHAGAAGKLGDPVVTLKLDPDEYIKGCTPLAPELAGRLLADPGAFYVNVHTTELPKGAIRGQLGQ